MTTRPGFDDWVAPHLAVMARRARGRNRPTVELVDGPATSPATERDLDLEHAVASLAARQREAIDLHYFAGLTVAETAVVMECAEGTVKSTLSDARGRLRLLLADEQTGERA